ncbi:MAG TPA: carbon storage regulator [Candidatus Sulfopaludibacter sp.]|nr:carbon storage regulator [Candidatus Sulfopaludibacter sp.]
MLVIRRHPGEAIHIGEDVEILVIDCGQGRVKLGIRAPKEISVIRGEVKLTREQNLAAARALESGPGFTPPRGLRPGLP